MNHFAKILPRGAAVKQVLHKGKVIWQAPKGEDPKPEQAKASPQAPPPLKFPRYSPAPLGWKGHR